MTTTMHPYLSTLESRFKSEWIGRFGASYKALQRIFELAEIAAQKKAEIAKPGKLSADGIIDALRKFYGEKLIPDIARARALLERDEAALTARRARFAIPAPDQKDVVAAMLRSEMRQYLRTLAMPERVALVLDPTNVLAIQASFEGSTILSGVPIEVLDRIEAAMIEALYGKELADIADEEEAALLRRMALDFAVGQVRRAGEWPDHGDGFDNFMAEHSADVMRQAKPPVPEPLSPLPPAFAWAVASPAPAAATHAEKMAQIEAKYEATVSEIMAKAAA